MRMETAKALLAEVTDTLAPQDVLRTLAEIYKAHREPHERRRYHKAALEDALRYHARQMENLENELTKETLEFVNQREVEDKREARVVHDACLFHYTYHHDKTLCGLGLGDGHRVHLANNKAMVTCHECKEKLLTLPSKEGSSGGPSAHE